MDRQLIARTLEKRGLQKNGLAAVLGIAESGVSALLKGERLLKAHEVPKVRKYLRLDSVPVIGFVASGGVVQFYDRAAQKPETISAPEEVTELTAALKIQADALGADVSDWYIYFEDQRPKIPRGAFNELCVVGLADGQTLIRRVKSSKAKGLYHLVSTVGGIVVDSPVEWASRVTRMQPR